MAAIEHLNDVQFVGTYHITDDPQEYYAGEAEWFATGEKDKPIRWKREEQR